MEIQLSLGIIVDQITADCSEELNIVDYITPKEINP